MSLLSRSSVEVLLSPVSVALTTTAGGRRPRRTTDATAVETERTHPEWVGALDALRSLLGHASIAAADASVVLSNHFVRYLTLPAAAGIAAREEQDYARARFTDVHGDAARHWTARANRSPSGTGWIAAATDSALLAALHQEFAGCGVRLVSCQPALMAQFNACRSRIGNDAWLVCVEQTRILVARIGSGQWKTVRNMPHAGGTVALEEILARENLLAGAGGDEWPVFASVADDVRVDAGSRQVETVLPGTVMAGPGAAAVPATA